MVNLRSGTKLKHLQSNKEMDSSKVNSSSQNPNGKNIQLIVFISLVIDLLGFTVILPLFPALLEYYSKHDSSGLYSLFQNIILSCQSYFNIPSQFNAVLFGGLLGSMFSFLQFLASPFCGALSDYYGRKKIIIICLVGITASYGLWFAASNFLIFVLARIIGGFSKGNVSLSYSVMADVLDVESRSKGMALIGIAFSIGFIIGPVVGVGFSKWGSSGWFAASAFYALCLAAFNVIFFSIFFKESLPKGKRVKTLKTGFQGAYNLISPKSLFNFDSVSHLTVAERHHLVRLGLVYFLYLFVYSGLEFTITFVTHYTHNFDSMTQGKMFTYLGILMALVQGGFVRRIKAGNEKVMCYIGFLMLIPAFLLIGMMKSRSGLYLGLTLYAVGSSLIVPCLTALASRFGPPSQKGTVLGIWRSLGALARASGPVVACFGFWVVGSSVVYSVGGLVLFLPIALLKTCDK